MDVKGGVGAARALLTRDLLADIPPLARWDWPRIVLGAGVACRVAAYLWNRPFWLDEGTIFGNIVGRPVFGFEGPLSGDQLAPFGFLIIERIFARVLGASNYALRLFPLACGIASLFLFGLLARRCLGPRAALLALIVFAFSDDLIYFSSELKPYSGDVTVALACLLMGSSLAEGPPTRRRILGAAALGVAAPWFSFPSVFVLAGIGLPLAWEAFRERGWRRLAVVSGLGMTWLASFALAYRASRALLDKYTTMYIFWAFAFLPLPPRSAFDLGQIPRAWLGFFLNPLFIPTPLGTAGSAILAWALTLVGAVAMARDRLAWAVRLALPGLLAMVASGLHLYPFHGRVLIFLVPSAILFLAEGLDWIWARSPSPRLGAVLVGFVLLMTMGGALIQMAQPRVGREFDPHGDLRKDVFLRLPPPR